jgi:hypothetical protein
MKPIIIYNDLSNLINEKVSFVMCFLSNFKPIKNLKINVQKSKSKFLFVLKEIKKIRYFNNDCEFYFYIIYSLTG